MFLCLVGTQNSHPGGSESCRCPHFAWQHSAAQQFQKQDLLLTCPLIDFTLRENCCMFWNSEPEAGKQNPKGWDPQRTHLQIAELWGCASWTNSCGTVVLREGKGCWGAAELQWKGMDKPRSCVGQEGAPRESCWPGHAHSAPFESFF